MLSAIECIAKADELSAKADLCGDEELRKAFHELAAEWRTLALMARTQEGLLASAE